MKTKTLIAFVALSVIVAVGHIYFTSLDGAVTVLKAGSKRAEIVAKNPKLDERTAATPAIADNTLYVRTEKHLYAFAEEKYGDYLPKEDVSPHEMQERVELFPKVQRSWAGP